MVVVIRNMGKQHEAPSQSPLQSVHGPKQERSLVSPCCCWKLCQGLKTTNPGPVFMVITSTLVQ